MKVAQINVTYGNADSTGRNVKELHDYLLEKKIDSYVFISKINDGSQADDRIRLFSSDTDRKTHALLSRLTGKQGYFSYFSTRRLIAELKAINPSVVILHVLHGNCVNLPELFKYLSKNDTSVVIVLHDCWFFTGHCCHYTYENCAKWQGDCFRCPQIHEWNESWFFDTASKCLKDKKQWFKKISHLGVIGVSDWITGEVNRSIIKDAAMIQRIYNWIDVEVFKPRCTESLRERLGIAKNTKVLLGVAFHWDERKGLKEMLLIARSIPESKVIMIGTIPENVVTPKNMICVGTVIDPIELSEYYSMADVFLNPSVQETFGKTTVEALSCGTPVVVYKTTACTELVGEKCGAVVSVIDAEQYLETLKDVLRYPKSEYETSCRESAVKRFDKGKCLDQYLSFINKMDAWENKK